MADENPGWEFLVQDLEDVKLTEDEKAYLKQCSGLSGSILERQGSEGSDGLSGRLSSLSSIMKWPPCQWNMYPYQVYKALKVEQYIVKTNNFLSANLHEAPCGYLNMDFIFKDLHKQSSWSVFEEQVENFLQIFDIEGVKELADTLLCDQQVALDKLKTLRNHIVFLQQSNLFNSDTSTVATEMYNILGKIYEDCKSSNIIAEHLLKEYILTLVNFFVTRAPHEFGLHCREECIGHLTLQQAKQQVKPNMILQCCGGTVLLVGQFKTFKESKLEREAAEESVAKKDGRKGGKRKLDSDSCEGSKRYSSKTKSVAGVSADDDEKTADNDRDKPSGCYRKDIGETECAPGGPSKRGSTESKPEVEVSANIYEKTTDSDHDKPSGCVRKDVEENDCASDDAREQGSVHGYGYRNMNDGEFLRVSHYLPELLAGMLANMQEKEYFSGMSVYRTPKLVHRNGNVQLGLAVEGFKLRFVRLDLTEMGNAANMTSMADLKRANVKCCVFLTRELNLFHKRHIKLFFQYLYALSFVYHSGTY